MGLENTYKTEKDKLAKEEELERTGLIKEEKEPMRMDEILADENKNQLLGKMVEQSGNNDDVELLKRLHSNSPEADDLAKIDKLRSEFETRINRVESIKEEINPELLKVAGENSPDFLMILKNAKTEKVNDLLKDYVADLAMTDPARFDAMAKKIEKLQEFKKGGFKDVEEEVKKIAETNKIDSDEYIKALAIDDSKNRNEALRDLVRNSWGDGKWGKTLRIADSVLSLAGFGSRMTADYLGGEKLTIDAALIELDKHRKDIGKVLSATVMGNEDMRKAFAKAIIGEPNKVEKAPGMKEMKDVLLKDGEVMADWKIVRDTVSTVFNGRSWEQLNDKEKDDVRTGFANTMIKKSKNKQGGKKGFWASLFDGLFNSYITNKKSALN